MCSLARGARAEHCVASDSASMAKKASPSGAAAASTATAATATAATAKTKPAVSPSRIAIVAGGLIAIIAAAIALRQVSQSSAQPSAVAVQHSSRVRQQVGLINSHVPIRWVLCLVLFSSRLFSLHRPRPPPLLLLLLRVRCCCLRLLIGARTVRTCTWVFGACGPVRRCSGGVGLARRVVPRRPVE